MSIELEKADRFAFPTGIMDIAMKGDGRLVYAACMDGIYELQLPNLPAPKPKTAEAEADDENQPTKEKNQKAVKKPAKEGAKDGSKDPEAKTPESEEKAKKAAKPKPRLIGRHGSYVAGIALIESLGSLLSTAYDGSFHIRDLNQLKNTADDAPEAQPLEPKHAERVHQFWSWDMALSPDQKWIASVTGQYLVGSEDYNPKPADEPTVKVFNAATGQLKHAFEMLPSVQCVAFDPSSRYVAAGNLMGDLAVWDLTSGEQLAQWRTKSFTSWGIIKSHCNIGGIFAVAFSPDGESLYAAGMGDMRDPMAGNGKQLWQRFAWRKSPPEKLQETVPEQAGEGLMEVLAFDPTGKHFVMAGRLRGGNWNVGIFSAESGQLIGQAKTGMRITSADFSADGKTLTLAGMQGQPGPKDGHFPDFGYLERYHVVQS